MRAFLLHRGAFFRHLIETMNKMAALVYFRTTKMGDLFQTTLRKLDKKWSRLSDACRALDQKGTGGLTLDQLSAAIRGFGAEVFIPPA